MTDLPLAAPRRLRSRGVVLTSLMAGAGLSLGACDNAPSATQWGDQTPAASQPVEAATFASLDECKRGEAYTDAECDTAYAEAQKASDKDGPRFADQDSCEARYGVAQCVPRSQAGGGSVFTPLLTGFIIGQAMSNMGGGYRGAPMYRDRDGGWSSGAGRPLSRDYVTGRATVRSDAFGPPRASAPSRMQSRSAVISRGGFGGGGRAYGG